jgi:hypothetical protein
MDLRMKEFSSMRIYVRFLVLKILLLKRKISVARTMLSMQTMRLFSPRTVVYLCTVHLWNRVMVYDFYFLIFTS